MSDEAPALRAGGDPLPITHYPLPITKLDSGHRSQFPMEPTARKYELARIGDIDIHYDFADYTDLWRERCLAEKSSIWKAWTKASTFSRPNCA